MEAAWWVWSQLLDAVHHVDLERVHVRGLVLALGTAQIGQLLGSAHPRISDRHQTWITEGGGGGHRVEGRSSGEHTCRAERENQPSPQVGTRPHLPGWLPGLGGYLVEAGCVRVWAGTPPGVSASSAPCKLCKRRSSCGCASLTRAQSAGRRLPRAGFLFEPVDVRQGLAQLILKLLLLLVQLLSGFSLSQEVCFIDLSLRRQSSATGTPELDLLTYSKASRPDPITPPGSTPQRTL